MQLKELSKALTQGKTAVLPTDTIYGLVGKALLPETVEKIYQIKGRKPDKPLIILISFYKDLELFGIKIDERTKEILEKYWPGKVSIILPCQNEKLKYLHRGTNTLAFRLPDYKELTDLINKTGPLVAPSANPEGQEPAKTIEEAKDYFGDKVDFYADAGKLESLPSTLIEITDHGLKVLREGEVKIKI